MAAPVQFSWGYLHTHSHTLSLPFVTEFNCGGGKRGTEEQRKGGKEDSAEIHFARCLVMRIGDLKRHTKHFLTTMSILSQTQKTLSLLLRSPFVNCCSSLNPSLIPISLLSFVSLPDPLLSLHPPSLWLSLPQPFLPHHPLFIPLSPCPTLLLFLSSFLTPLFSSSLSPWQRQLCLGSRALVIQNNTFHSIVTAALTKLQIKSMFNSDGWRPLAETVEAFHLQRGWEKRGETVGGESAGLMESSRTVPFTTWNNPLNLSVTSPSPERQKCVCRGCWCVCVRACVITAVWEEVVRLAAVYFSVVLSIVLQLRYLN